MTYDSITNPEHYTAGRTMEPIEVIKDWGHLQGFCIGNAIKYISRYQRKEANDILQDLRKAVFYLNKLITHEEDKRKIHNP